MAEGEGQTTVFNMSLATLERIDRLIIDLSSYTANGNFLAVKSNIIELYKELYPFLNEAKEQPAGDERLEVVLSYNAYFDKRGQVNYDDYLPDVLMDFDFWIRQKLKDKGLLMAAGEDLDRIL